MSTDPHETLVQKASRGERDAIDALVERHFPRLLGYLRLHVDPVIREHESCIDLAQSICREILESPGDFEYRGEAAFRNWLFKRAMAKLVNRKKYYLREKRDPGRLQRLSAVEAAGDGLPSLYATICSPTQNAIARETVERLERCFAELSPEQKQVISMSRLAGMSHREIAEELGREQSTVRVILHRALFRLGRLMDEGS